MSSELDYVGEGEMNADEEEMGEFDGEADQHGDDADSSEAAQTEARPKINVDDVLRELVDRKSKMQSYSQFNLDAAVADLNDEYTRALASNSRNRNCRRELRNIDATADMDRSASRISSQIKNLVEHNNEDSYKAVTKFDEMMKRLKATAAAHKQNIPNETATGATQATPTSEPVESKADL